MTRDQIMAESGERFRGIADAADTEEGRKGPKVLRCGWGQGEREAVAPAPSIPILATEQIDFGRLAVIVILQSMSYKRS